MDGSRKRAYLAIVAMMALAALCLLLTDEVPASGEAGVKRVLPDSVGTYEGEDIWFCQNEQCMRSYLASQLGDSDVCLTCTNALDAVSLGEKRLLPDDTILAKKQYVGPGGQPIFASIVLSGREQKSIHRPQQCLPAQGHVIEKSRVIEIPVEGRQPLKVMLLDLHRAGSTLEGKHFERMSTYAYWFVGTGRETPYHLQRLFWMTTDRVFRNINHRWAYISVTMTRNGDTEAHVNKLSEFIAQMYPLVIEPQSEVDGG
ncbi:MAG: exosortase-associated EpsI family protein [Kiritimatiellia bacterium]|jgi:hypothetical protein|nr:exosortase-associated EpsI family protein [Kiritimatiellia bacterium]MDP6847893.1 exosortase-associated EpsI family protein [Kiritimatiellia bacterium]